MFCDAVVNAFLEMVSKGGFWDISWMLSNNILFSDISPIVVLGPRLPKPLASAAMVSIGADKLYVIGGIDNGDESFSSHIYELQNSGSSSQWSDFHRKLAVPRAGTVAIPIPDELALC